jgi:hypothetical protein
MEMGREAKGDALVGKRSVTLHHRVVISSARVQ